MDRFLPILIMPAQVAGIFFVNNRSTKLSMVGHRPDQPDFGAWQSLGHRLKADDGELGVVEKLVCRHDKILFVINASVALKKHCKLRFW